MSEISITGLQNSFTKSSSMAGLSRTELYKNTDKNVQQLRRRRNETIIELRKQKKESDSDRRRNISCYELWSDNEDNDEKEDIDLTALQIIDTLKTTDITGIAPKYIRYLRKLSPKEVETGNDDNKIMELLMNAHILTKLNSCLSTENCSMSLLQEVVALIAYICSRDKKLTLIIVSSGFVPNLLSLLSYDSFGVREQSIIALAYIWDSSREMAQMLNSTQFLNLLVGLIDSETSVSPSKFGQSDGRIGLVRGLSWALFVICQNQDQTQYKVSEPLIPYFVKLLKFSDTEVKTNVLKSLSATTERVLTIQEEETSPVRKMVHSVVSNDSLFSLIIDYLTSNEDKVVFNAIRIIGNIVSWGESFAQIIIQAKALQSFGVILTHHNSKVQREGAYTVSNITAGNFAQIQAVIDANLVPPIVELLYMGDFRTQVEASHVLLNISAVGSLSQIYYILNVENSLTNMDVIDAMVTLITSPDPSVINTCLQFYNNVLVLAKSAKVLNAVLKRCETSSLVYHLDSLQSHSNTQIAVLATHIMDEFFANDLSFEEDINWNTSLTTDEPQMETNFSF